MRGGGYQPEYILLPASTLFIWFSLLLAFGLNILPWGRLLGMPDFLALALVFWNTHQPRKVGIGAAFAFGLMMDVHDASLLGEHALAYTLISYVAITLHRRVLWFSLPAQIAYVLPLLFMTQVVVLAIRMMIGATFPGMPYFLQSVVGAALWPLISYLLFAPQRRAVDRDETRPL
jgi:rod shape-determining protein MreD